MEDSPRLHFRLHLLNQTGDDPGAVCLDGSPAGFYYAISGEGVAGKRWALQLEGGGWCYTWAQCMYRAKREKTGSSRSWPDEILLANGPMSSSPEKNYDFHYFHRVYVKYCDGASFAGDVDSPVYQGGEGKLVRQRLYYRGRRIIAAVMKRLMSAEFGLATLPDTELALFGCSAGGLAVIFNADFVGSILLSAPGVTLEHNPDVIGAALRPAFKVKYRAVSGSGFFASHANLDGAHVYESQMRQVFQMQNLAATLPGACVDHFKAISKPWKCALAGHVARFVNTPLFFLDSTVDSWQLGCILTTKRIEDDKAEVSYTSQCYRKTDGWENCSQSYMLPLLTSCVPEQLKIVNTHASDFVSELMGSGVVKKSGNGAFITSCVSHCGFSKPEWNTVTLSPRKEKAEDRKGGEELRSASSFTMQEAVGRWWHESTKTVLAASDNEHHIYLPCELHAEPPFQCNPTCLGAPMSDDTWDSNHWMIGIVLVPVALIIALCSVHQLRKYHGGLGRVSSGRKYNVIGEEVVDSNSTVSPRAIGKGAFGKGAVAKQS